MLIDRTIEQSKSDDYLSLIPEIARLLNMSVSTVKRYPNDIQHILCEIYANNYKADEITLKQALGQVVQLNSETEQEIKNSTYASEKAKKVDKVISHKHNENSQIQQEHQEVRKRALLTREQIIRNAKIIRDNYYNQQQGQFVEQNEQIERKKQG